MISIYLISIYLLIFSHITVQEKKNKLVVFTVATEDNEAYQRFIRSADRYSHDVRTLGLGQAWKGGDMETSTGGGQKVNLLADALTEYREDSETIVMFVDSYDLVIGASPDDIVDKFLSLEAKLLFSAEDFCWPDRHLKEMYPEVSSQENRFLNSGGIIGFANVMYSAVTHARIKDGDDDQRFYTSLFLNKKLNEKYSIKLDTKTEIFQNLHGALNEMTLVLEEEHSYLYNNRTTNKPMIFHGNGPMKIEFDTLANYLADEWTVSSGCKYCTKDLKQLPTKVDEDSAASFPAVYMALLLEQDNPFSDLYFDNIAALDYPKSRITVFVYYKSEMNRKDVELFRQTHSNDYAGFEVFEPTSDKSIVEASNHAIREALSSEADYYFHVDGTVQLENNATLQHLVTSNRLVSSPMVARHGKLWTNFWGSIDQFGFYSRSIDYEYIVNNVRRGVWVVPHISNVYLVNAKKVLPHILGAYTKADTDSDMAFTSKLRQQKIFMYVDNRQYFGHLVVTDGEKVENRARPDLYEIFNNKYTWEKKYISHLFNKHVEMKLKNEMPCPDVYWIPLVSEKFCDDIIDEMEHYGDWSGGRNNNKDNRIAGGYENVPTVDIHMTQIGWDAHWLQIIKDYITQYNDAIFTGHHMEGKSHMNFVVRYKPSEQDRLKPHHDASTVTINMALNNAKIDFQGGGPRFIRYNCSLPDTRKGWMLMNPGRVTHYHEGLPTTHGTRYILVSFIDP